MILINQVVRELSMIVSLLQEKDCSQIRYYSIPHAYCVLLVQQVYKMCTKEYIADGKDGYDILKPQQRLVSIFCIKDLHQVLRIVCFILYHSCIYEDLLLFLQYYKYARIFNQIRTKVELLKSCETSSSSA